MKNKTIGIIGGDLRMAYTANSFLRDDYDVYITGFDKCNIELLGNLCNLEDALKCENIVLPFPLTKDNKTVYSPYSDTNIVISDIKVKSMEDKKIFCAMLEKLKNINEDFNDENLKIYDYSKNVSLIEENAVLTAKACYIIACDLENILNKNIMVTGWGRVGKSCCREFSKHGYNVCATARKEKDFKEILSCGYEYQNTYDMKNIDDFGIIINTIPHMIFDKNILDKLTERNIIIDLASTPGGVDFKSAKEQGITAVQALGLPGKYFPYRAGKIIKNTIHSIIEGGTL